jgi:hypothetical protein
VRYRSLSSICGMATIALVIGRGDVRQAAAEPPAAGGVAAPAAEGAIAGKVVETMDAGPYTYVQVDDGSKKIWAAAPHFTVSVGDKVIVPSAMPMRDFESKTLKRTFDLVYFAQTIQIVGAAAGKAAAAHGSADQGTAPGMLDHGIPGHGAPPATHVDLSSIKKADGGQTVNELFVKKGDFVGKDIVVRGRVVKYTGAVMGKNWIHVQDGTGTAGANDLTVTTDATAAVGDTVLVRGKLSADKDFGFGYKYDILVEDAKVSVE